MGRSWSVKAVADAVGVRITELPITAEKVLARLRGKVGRGWASLFVFHSAHGLCV